MTSQLFPDLDEGHRSRIRITLTLVDEALAKFSAWARGQEVRALLYAEENDLTPGQREALLADVAGIRRIIQELHEDLALKTQPQSVARAIRASSYVLWVDVLEMTGKYLRGFGEPSPQFVDYLDPRAHQILQYLDHIKILLAE
jgi:hypothetical protein